MTKKRMEQLENLLDWEREGDRLPKTRDLFNRKIGDCLYLRETSPRKWVLELFSFEGSKIKQLPIYLKNETLVQLGLTILEASKVSSDKYVSGGG